MSFEEARNIYEKLRIGTRRLGFGQKPAVLVIDMQNDAVFGDEDPPYTMAQNIIPNIKKLLDEARKAGVPVFYVVYVVHPSQVDNKIHATRFRPDKKGMLTIEGTKGAEVPKELEPQPGDFLIRKRRSSAFFGTDLETFLNGLGSDTLILTGLSLAGCVMATAVDGHMRDYHMIIPRECVAERAKYIFEAEMSFHVCKYADILSIDEVLQYVRNLGSSSSKIGV